MITIRSLSRLMCTIIIAGACESAREPLAPVDKIRASAITSPVTYRVQAFTSFNGQIYNFPDCLEYAWMTWEHNVGGPGNPPAPHLDSIMSVTQNGTCGAPNPYNGGWVHVHEVRADGDHAVGTVEGNLVWKDFTYSGPDYLQIRLTAFASPQNCQFLYFDNYPAGQTSIVVPGAGELPLAQFYCSSPP